MLFSRRSFASKIREATSEPITFRTRLRYSAISPLLSHPLVFFIKNNEIPVIAHTPAHLGGLLSRTLRVAELASGESECCCGIPPYYHVI